MSTQKTIRVFGIGLFVVTVVLAIIPVLQTLGRTDYRGVVPEYVDDDLYYYSRMKEVAEGKPFIGNSYFIEHRDARAVAFFVADWAAAIPLFLGVSFSPAIVLNFIFWSLVFVFLVYRIGRIIEIPPPYSALIGVIAYCEVYWLVLRPVIMQEVFPFFLLFLLAVFIWLREPLRRRSILLLVVTGAIPFYIYTYLWQIVFVILGVIFLHKTWQKRWLEVKTLLWVALGSGLLALPAIAYTIYQISDPLYWETMKRVGLFESHLPAIDVYLYGRWVILTGILYFCVHKWAILRESVVFWAVTYSGIGLLVVSLSNIITGKDVATAEHVGRFITLWVAIFFPVILWKLWMSRREVWKLAWFKILILGGLILGCMGFLVSNLQRSLPFPEIANTDSVTIQEYADPLHWLQEREAEPLVIWANEEISMYVPILTRHYVFWTNVGGLQMMSTKEVEDRFLASQVRLLTLDDLFASYERFQGSGVGRRYEDFINKNKIRCLVGGECKADQSMREWIGDAKLELLAERQRQLKKDIAQTMKTYHISYIIADMTKSEDVYFKSLPGVQQVWRDNRFVVYEIQ